MKKPGFYTKIEIAKEVGITTNNLNQKLLSYEKLKVANPLDVGKKFEGNEYYFPQKYAEKLIKALRDLPRRNRAAHNKNTVKIDKKSITVPITITDAKTIEMINMVFDGDTSLIQDAIKNLLNKTLEEKSKDIEKLKEYKNKVLGSFK